jgi:DNA-binding transcriptional MerR regulator
VNISQLVARAGATAKAIRFYEAEGIVPAPKRAANGHRIYDDDDLCRLRLVVALRSIGIQLAESGRLAGLCRSGRCDAMTGELKTLTAQRRRAGAASRAELDHLDLDLASVERVLQSGESRATLCLGKEDAVAAVRLPVRS